MIATGRRSGPAVVLVADRTLSADYRVLFEAIFATMQTTQAPEPLMRRLLAPRMPADAAGGALAAPLGLRRVEAALRADGGLGDADVVCTTPEAVGRLLGPWTRVVAVSSSDPLGRGMSNTTSAWFCGGELYTRTWTGRMMRAIRRAKDRFGFAVVAGGAGAWQWAQDPRASAAQGIDVVYDGYFESAGPGLFAELLSGRPVPAVVTGSGTAVDGVRPILGPSVLGAVELTRGCGRGCGYCAMARHPMAHLPVELIVADLATNAAAGRTAVVTAGEDFFRYGSAGPRVNLPRLMELLEAMRRVRGLSFVQLDHANVSSVLQLDDAELAEVRRLLSRRGGDYLWLNLGAESANGRLVAENGPGKILPFRPEDWGEMVRESADRLNQAGFFPVFSVILGLPGETPDDVAATLELVRFLGGRRAAVFPIFHEPVRPDTGDPFTLPDMRPDHFELFTTCYEINFRQVPRLYWHNQHAGGVSWVKRMLVQALGRAEMVSWRRTFARIGRERKW